MKITNKIVILSLCLALAGCATRPIEKTNDYVETKLPEQWTQGEQNTDSDIKWIDRFNEPELSRLINSALNDGYLIQSALSRLAQMDASARLTGAIKHPTFSIDFQHGKQETMMPNIGIVESDINQLNLSTQWQIDLWGKVKNQHAAQFALLEAAGYQYEDLRLTVASSIAKTWFNVLEAQKQYDLSVKVRDSFEHQLKTMEDRYLKGIIDGFDLRLFRAQTAQNEAAVSQRKQQLDVITRQLQVILSNYPDGELLVKGDFFLSPDPIPEKLTFDVLTRRPDLRAAERQLASKLGQKKSADKNRLPNLQLRGSWGTSSNEISDLLDSDYLLKSIIGSITAPIFSGGRLNAEQDLADAQFQEQIHQYNQSVLEAFKEIETASKSETYLEQIESDLRKVVEEITNAEKQAWDLYNRGLRDITAVLDVQRTSSNVQSQYLSIQNQRILNRIDFHVAIGGDY